MTLTSKEIATLEVLNKKGLVYEYVQVEVLGLGGVTKLVNKIVKVYVKKEANKPTYFDKSLGLVGNDVIMNFIKTDAEIAGQKRENEINLPSSMRKF